MALSSRTDLINYCLRRLGSPVIQINVAPEQLNDRCDDALQKFAEYHFNGTFQQYYKYQVTDQDKINNYITLPDNIIGITQIFPMQGFAINGGDMFDARYQMALSDMNTMTGMNLVPYTMTMTHLNTMNELLIGRVPIRYNRRNGNQLYLDTNWSTIETGSYLIVDAQQVIDPDEFDGVYDEMWLKEYLTALIKKQWGTNLSKFTGMPLPGGMQLNGLELIQQAEQELQKCQQDLEEKYMEMPLMRMA